MICAAKENVMYILTEHEPKSIYDLNAEISSTNPINAEFTTKKIKLELVTTTRTQIT